MLVQGGMGSAALGMILPSMILPFSPGALEAPIARADKPIGVGRPPF